MVDGEGASGFFVVSGFGGYGCVAWVVRGVSEVLWVEGEGRVVDLGAWRDVCVA